MATAEPSREHRPEGSRGGARRWIWPALALVLGGGLALRLWGVQAGSPVRLQRRRGRPFRPACRRNVRATERSNPHYFANPPAFTYVLHFLYAVWYGSAAAVAHAYSAHPGDLFTLARVSAAVLGTLALWLLYLTGARLFGRAVGLLAAASSGRLPAVFYSHLALNDVPTLAPSDASLLGSAGVLRKGRARITCSRGSALAWRARPSTRPGSCCVPYLAAALCRHLAEGSRPRSAHPAHDARRHAARGHRGCSHVLRGQPLLGARLLELPQPSWCTSLSCRLKHRASSGRPSTAASSTTCGP